MEKYMVMLPYSCRRRSTNSGWVSAALIQERAIWLSLHRWKPAILRFNSFFANSIPLTPIRIAKSSIRGIVSVFPPLSEYPHLSDPQKSHPQRSHPQKLRPQETHPQRSRPQKSVFKCLVLKSHILICRAT
uniref:Uncharacterized protein n=1 Tax=Meloidogyne incognita TaxID=6306 RepID=A0A914MYP4_MELIC